MDMSLTKPVSAEQPCGPDPEYDPEYLLLFSRAAPQAEAQYGDFVSTPEAVNWPEIERDARRLLTRSKDIRVLILLRAVASSRLAHRDWRKCSHNWQN